MKQDTDKRAVNRVDTAAVMHLASIYNDPILFFQKNLFPVYIVIHMKVMECQWRQHE